MDPAIQLIILFTLVVGVNLMPAFGPPTWTIIVFYSLNTDIPAPAIIIAGALAAALGRFGLAMGFRLLARHVSQNTRGNLAAARETFERKRRNGIIALMLFALSPVPSAQLFEAAGLAGVKLTSFTVTFFIGRIISYAIYTYSAKGLRHSALGDVIAEGITSPLGIGLQVLMIAALVAMTRIDWQKLLDRTG